jgi:hypothetical protein|tara:strand:+ start:50 stop:265 length:216 start_codon:yes stop_codon:yes gene_type:complete
MGHTLEERMDIMLELMDKHYGPNRIKRMTKEDIDKMSILFGITREERKESHQIIQEIIINKTKGDEKKRIN